MVDVLSDMNVWICAPPISARYPGSRSPTEMLPSPSAALPRSQVRANRMRPRISSIEASAVTLVPVACDAELFGCDPRQWPSVSDRDPASGFGDSELLCEHRPWITHWISSVWQVTRSKVASVNGSASATAC